MVVSSGRLRPNESDLQSLDNRNGVSVGYAEHKVETVWIAGEKVRIIKSAILREISAVTLGAVKQSYLVIRDESKVSSLRDDVQHFAYDGAFVALQRALRKLDAE